MSGERALLLVGMLLSWGCPGDKVGTGDSGKADDSGDSGDSDSAVDADDTAHTDDSSATDDTDDTDDSAPPPVDNDGDGYDTTVDCDDDDASVHPGAEDTWYDGVDLDCSGSDYDADGDGHDSPDYGGDDCDDADADPPTNTSSVITLGAVPACDKTARVSGMLVGKMTWDYARSEYTSGDINGDGFGDILAQSRYSDEAEEETADGVGYVVFGPVAGEKSLSDAGATFTSNIVESTVIGISGLGDTNADGYEDLAVLLQDAAGVNAHYIFDGPQTGDVIVEFSDAVLNVTGTASAVGDFDGDGFADLLADTVEMVFLGPLSGTLAASDAYLSYSASGSACPSPTSYAVGDINADGLDDIVLTCVSKGAYFFYGGTAGTRETSDADAFIGDGFDGARAAGDNDGDGYDDVVLGLLNLGSSTADHTGRQYLYHGPVVDGADTGDADAIWSGETSDDYLYATAACDSDLNADGLDDVVLLTSERDFNYVHIMLAPGSGVGTQSDADWSLNTEGSGSVLEGLGRLGDTDGDGYEDIALGNPRLEVHEPQDGAVWILSGGTF